MTGAPPAVASLLAEAFAPDPLMRHAFATGEAPAPATALALLFGRPLAACALAGSVVGETEGAAAWLPAEPWPPPPRLAWRAGFAALPAALPPAVLWRFLRHERSCAPALREGAAGAGYIWLFGVSPGSRRRGFGRALLERVCAAMALRFRRCLLKTENADSLAFYHRCGFATRATLTAASGLTVWVLERPLTA